MGETLKTNTTLTELNLKSDEMHGTDTLVSKGMTI